MSNCPNTWVDSYKSYLFIHHPDIRVNKTCKNQFPVLNCAHFCGTLVQRGEQSQDSRPMRALHFANWPIRGRETAQTLKHAPAEARDQVLGHLVLFRGGDENAKWKSQTIDISIFAKLLQVTNNCLIRKYCDIIVDRIAERATSYCHQHEVYGL